MQMQQQLLPGGFIAPLLANARSLNFDFPYDALEPVPFTISVDKAFIAKTQTKVKLYRSSPDLRDDSNFEWIEGPPHDNMARLAHDWAESYDWFKVEEEINSNFSHFAVTIQSPSEFDHPVPLHFVHERSADPDAVPLLLLHGWPSTHLEWAKILKPLSSQGNASFHIVAPDLPAFGFSPAPEYSGLGPRQMAVVFDTLMKKLSYENYGVVSTDLGWLVGSWMAVDIPTSLIGHFTDFFLIQPNATDLERYAQNQTTQEETLFIESMQTWSGTRSSYATVHQQAPLAIGQALSDSPVGFAGWMWHLLYGGSDDYPYTSSQLATQAMMLWIQGTWGNLRIYKEFFQPDAMSFPKSKVPTAVTQWGLQNIPSLKSFNFAPRDWIERMVNLVYFTRHEKGAHFPAEHAPDAWIEEVRQFFGGLASGQL